MPDFGGDDIRDALDDAPDVSVDDDAMIGRDDPEPVPARRPAETSDTDTTDGGDTATDTTGVDRHGDESRASTRSTAPRWLFDALVYVAAALAPAGFAWVMGWL